MEERAQKALCCAVHGRLRRQMCDSLQAARLAGVRMFSASSLQSRSRACLRCPLVLSWTSTDTTRSARAAAADGAYHLKRLQALLQTQQLKHPSVPDAATIAATQRELAAAEHDFALVRRDLGEGAFSTARNAGVARGTLATVAALATAADEACLAGLDLTQAALVIEPHLHADLFASGSASALAFTANEMARVTADYEDAVRHLTVAVSNAQHADLSALPGGTLTSQQIAAIHQALAAWPRVAPQLEMADGWLHVAPGLLDLHGPDESAGRVDGSGRDARDGRLDILGDDGILTIENAKVVLSPSMMYSRSIRPTSARRGCHFHPPPIPGGRFAASGYAIRISRHTFPPARN